MPLSCPSNMRLFQSAPAITGGRSSLKSSGKSSRSCFNPRPPSLAGDPAVSAQIADALAVSIRARHNWRAILPTPTLMWVAARFQSAPAITGGRSGVAAVAFRAYLSVSIRARHHWRAIPICADTAGCATMFQSAPAITGGRSEPMHWITQLLSGFNPRPPSLAGDPAAGLRWACRSWCFNPRPPSLAGDPSGSPAAPKSIWVSIRARHHWRAIRPIRHRCRAAKTRFNPRPPSLAGDPLTQLSPFYLDIVSIRARHHWRAIQSGKTSRGARTPVSIRARHHWRAIQLWLLMIFRLSLFQSAPAITGGRSAIAAAPSTSTTRFQSAPAITGGRSPPADPRRLLKLWFQSAPAITGGRSDLDCHGIARSEMFQSAPAITGGRSVAPAGY